MKRLVGMITALMAIVLLPAAAMASAGAGAYNVPATVQLKDSGCFYVPYSASLNFSSDTVDWSLDTRILSPNGTIFDFGFDYGTGSTPVTSTEEMFFCSSIDAIGTYTVTGVLTTDNANYDSVETALSPQTFQVLPYVAPTPPPTTYVQVAGEVTKSSYRKSNLKYKAVVRTESDPGTPNSVGTPLKWTLKLGSKTVDSLTQLYSEKGSLRYQIPQKAKTRTYKVRVLQGSKVDVRKTVTVRGTAERNGAGR